MRNFIDIASGRVVLHEAQNYEDMFSALNELNITARFWDNRYWNDEVSKAKEWLKRSDRIVWYLRLLRLAKVRAKASALYVDKDAAEVKAIIALGEKYAKEAERAMPGFFTKIITDTIEGDNFVHGRNQVRAIDILQARLRHMMQMTAQIPALDAIRFTNQTPIALLREANIIEEKWKKEQTGLIPHDPTDGKTILSFPDGFAWVRLPRGYCPTEAKAMGHCGNEGGDSDGERILSLRRIVEKNGQKYSRPSLTFILHTDGYLGEMKGRENNKPSERYHPYIAALLRLPMIKGINGGGYKPENNFALLDLPHDEALALFHEKPDLATLSDEYLLTGMTPELEKKFKKTLVKAYSKPDMDLINTIKWWPKAKRFIIHKYRDWYEAASRNCSADVQPMLKVLKNNSPPPYYAKEDDFFSVLGRLPANVQNFLVDYVSEKKSFTKELTQYINDERYGILTKSIYSYLHKQDDKYGKTILQIMSLNHRKDFVAACRRDIIASLFDPAGNFQTENPDDDINLVDDLPVFYTLTPDQAVDIINEAYTRYSSTDFKSLYIRIPKVEDDYYAIIDDFLKTYPELDQRPARESISEMSVDEMRKEIFEIVKPLLKYHHVGSREWGVNEYMVETADDDQRKQMEKLLKDYRIRYDGMRSE